MNKVDLNPWYKEPWPWLLMLGPMLVVIAASYTGWIAFTRQDALVVDDYYKQGKAINMDLHRDTVATKLGLALDVTYNPAQGQLIGKLTSFGHPYSGTINLIISHATQPEKDKKISAQVSLGEFQTPLPFLEADRWNVTIENSDRDWRLTGMWKWPEQRKIELIADLPPAE